jgi:thioredoxin-dependent peroxiredoxin
MSFMAISLVSVAGCASSNSASQSGFVYKDLPMATRTVLVGPGTTVTFGGSALAMSGPGLQLGDVLRSAKVTARDLSVVDVAGTKGKVRVISIVPSVDTEVCEQQTHYLSEKNRGLDKQAELVTVSIDTPFAQDRFAKQANINNVTFFSDYREAEFGKAHGLLLEGPHFLSRAVMVVDENNVIRYLQVTPDIGQMPDMEAAFEAARSLVGAARRS